MAIVILNYNYTLYLHAYSSYINLCCDDVFVVKLNDKDDYTVNTYKPIVSVVKLFGEGGSPSSTQILEHHTAIVAIANGIKELVGRSYCTTATTPLTTTNSTTITATHNEMVQEHEGLATSNVSQTHDLFDHDLITCAEFSSEHHTAIVAIANGIKELVGRSYCTTATTPLTTTNSTTITATHNEMVQEHEGLATSNVSQTHDLFDHDLITCTEFSSDHTSNDQVIVAK